ncbi:MAG: metal-dependent hydrolase [Planctomycetia bacterium]|nr:metal-dependent hydrolase [Planctomycetia bacterium]
MEQSTLQWLGHNAWLFEHKGFRILVDPFLTGNPKAAVAADAVKADFILVSHGHEDHLGDTLKLAKRTGAAVITVAEIAAWLSKQGIKKVIGMNVGGGVNTLFGRVEMTPAFHSSTLPDGSSGGVPCGFLIKVASGGTIYFACDTGVFGDMKLLAEKQIKIAVLPIGDVYTMGPEESLKAIQLLQPKVVIPCHYDTWKLIAQDTKEWEIRVRKETQAVPCVLTPGEKIQCFESEE